MAYHDVDNNNIGLAYRPDEGVDLEGAGGGGYDVYWIVAGEWLEYTFSVPTTGHYNFIPYVSTVPGAGNFTMSIDNVDVSGRRNVLSTGGWQFWTPIPIENVPLDAGVHRLRFDFASDFDQSGWLFSLNYIDVELVTATAAEALPARPEMDGNFPNPFNPRTAIDFRLPAKGPARIVVLDARGRVVRTLVDAVLEAGAHRIDWDGRDDDGRELPSGIYYQRMSAFGEVQTGKMVLLK